MSRGRKQSPSKIIHNIVIAGAGPIGLYLAIRLNELIKLNNLQANVIVADQRAGKYSRPGVIASQALIEMEKSIGPVKSYVRNPTPNSMFIQDLETALYGQARESGVKFASANFEGFDTSAIKLRDGSGKTLSIACDLAIDCTGQKRSLAVEANRLISGKDKPFKISPAAAIPVKNHFIAYIKMDEKHAEAALKDNKDPAQRKAGIKLLRDEFGWQDYEIPTIETGRWPDPVEKGKICAYYYFEIPQALTNEPRERHIAFLKALLKAKSGHDVEFEADADHKRFSPFIVDPQMVAPACHAPDDGSTPAVVVCGDAQIDPDYRIGHGIRSGVSRANTLVDAMSCGANGELILNTQQYNQLVEMPLNAHRKELFSYYSWQLDSLAAAYTKALNTHPDGEERKILLSSLLHLAEKYKNHAGAAYASNNFVAAADNYNKSLNIYLNHFHSEHLSKIITLYSNICLTAMASKDYPEALQAANTALTMLKTSGRGQFADIDSVIQKLKFNKCRLVLIVKSDQLNDKTSRTEFLQEYFAELLAAENFKLIDSFLKDYSIPEWNLNLIPKDIINESTYIKKRLGEASAKIAGAKSGMYQPEDANEDLVHTSRKNRFK